MTHRFLHDPTALTLLNDPFIMEEGDPSKSRALESSLWEVEALSQHVLPNVSTVAKNILKANQRTEYDLSQVLELTESDVSIRWFIIFPNKYCRTNCTLFQLFDKCVSNGAENKSYHTRIPNSLVEETTFALY